MRLTGTGLLILLATLAFAMAALTSQSGLLVLLSGLLLGCLVVNEVHSRKVLHQLRLDAPPVCHAEEKNSLADPWVVANLGRRPASLITAVHPEGVLFEVSVLEPGEHRHVVPHFRPPRRGVYHWRDVRLQTTHPFGLFCAHRRMPLEGELVVYPALYPVAAPPAAGYDVMLGGKHRGSRRIASGTHFAGVRPLQSGDPLKQIHWPSSAKGVGLMVKTYEEELSGRLSVLLDPGHTGDRATADACVRAAGSLMFVALDEGHHVEWMVLGSDSVELVPPFSDGHELLDALARLPVQPGVLTTPHLQQACGHISSRSAVVLVVTTVNEAVAQAVQELSDRRRPMTLCVPAPAYQWPVLSGVTVWEYGEDYLTPSS